MQSKTELPSGNWFTTCQCCGVALKYPTGDYQDSFCSNECSKIKVVRVDAKIDPTNGKERWVSNLLAGDEVLIPVEHVVNKVRVTTLVKFPIIKNDCVEREVDIFWNGKYSSSTIKCSNSRSRIIGW